MRLVESPQGLSIVGGYFIQPIMIMAHGAAGPMGDVEDINGHFHQAERRESRVNGGRVQLSLAGREPCRTPLPHLEDVSVMYAWHPAWMCWRWNNLSGTLFLACRQWCVW